MWVITLLLGVCALGLTACNDDEPSQLVNCEEGAPEEWDSCYDFSDKAMHCLLVELRDAYAAGRFELDQLPGWAITEERNGAPIIYDVRATDHPFRVSGEARGRLMTWAERTKGVPPIDDASITSCAESLTEAEMREAEGGGEGTTEWESGEAESAG